MSWKGLKDESDTPATEARTGILVECPEVHAIERHTSCGGTIEAREKPEQRGLAAAGRADDGEKATALEFEGDILEDAEPPTARRVLVAECLAGKHRRYWRGGSFRCGNGHAMLTG